MSSISIILTIGMVIVFTIIGIIIVRKEKKKAKERRRVFSISLLFVFTFLLIFFSLVLAIQMFLIYKVKPFDDFTFLLCLIGIVVAFFGVTNNTTYILEKLD